MSSNKIVLWFDEDEGALRTYQSAMDVIFGSEVEVKGIIPPKTIDELIDIIQSESSTVAIAVDHRLKTTGEVQFDGMEAAEAIRGRGDIKIPIYILTNYSEDSDIISNEFNVEYVLDKDKMSNEIFIKNMTARIRRHIDIFQDMLSKRESRFEELLRKSLVSELNADEQKDFNDLDFWRSKPILAREEPRAKELKANLDKQEKKLNDLKSEIESKLGTDDGS